MNNSMERQIYSRISSFPLGTIFTNSDFYDLATQQTVKKALSRLAKSSDVHRLIDGFYTIPNYSKVLEEYSFPTADDLACKIADKFAWSICPYGETALNFLGLSTQISNNYEFISDGPYRTYTYREKKIIFKHTATRSISCFSKELSILIQAIKAYGKENIKDKEIKRMSIYCEKYIKENLIQEAKNVPTWIYEELRKISEIKNFEEKK